MKKLLSLGILFLFFLSSCDKCSDTDCQNGGVCEKGECTCPFEWEGESCEVKTLTKHMGLHEMTLNAGTFIHEGMELALIADATDAKKFYFGDVNEGAYAFLTSATAFNFPTQTVTMPDGDGGFYQIEVNGSGNFTANGFTATLNATGSSASFTLTATKI
jgi:hypothetical protein